MAWRINPHDGTRVWVDDSDTATMGATQPVADSSPTLHPVLPNQAPTAPPPPAQPQHTMPVFHGNRPGQSFWGVADPTNWSMDPVAGDGMHIQFPSRPPGMHGGFGNWDFSGSAPTTAPVAPPAPRSVPLDFTGAGPTSEDQAYLTALQGIHVGGPELPATPQLPERAPRTADPALGFMAQHAQTQGTEMHGLLDQARQYIESDNPNARSKWQKLGEWLSAVAADGHLENSGAIASQLISRDREMQREYHREIIDLTMKGFGVDDAQAQAQANLLSGQHSATEQTADDKFNRDSAQTGMQYQHDVTNAQIGAGTASAQAHLAEEIARATHDVYATARTSHDQALSALSGDPQYGSQANSALAAERFQDPRTAHALGAHLDTMQSRQGLAAFIQAQGMVPSHGTQRQQLLEFYRQWDPTLQDSDLQNLQGPALLYRLTAGSGAQQAFARNRERLATFASMAPAQ